MADKDSTEVPDAEDSDDELKYEPIFDEASDPVSEPDSEPEEEEGEETDAAAAPANQAVDSFDPFVYRFEEDPSEPLNEEDKDYAQKVIDILNSQRLRRRRKKHDLKRILRKNPFNFPRDPENWTEADLGEFWEDPPIAFNKTGWDPVFATDRDWQIIELLTEEGKDPPIAPFYVPYRKPNPVIPNKKFNAELSTPKAVIEELDMIEEFMRWGSFIFADGSTYEGTFWDDLAHGKGVFEGRHGLVRYEGEWIRNDMDGHGVAEMDIPDDEPIPGSEHEAEMRAQGRIFARDFMSPEDREWLEKDIEDSILLAGDNYELPFYENNEWITEFGEKPEKGRYRYAGQWKHGRMHGCGVYEINERTIYGKFYFGELLEDSDGCDDEVSALHAGIAEVAAAKARMFVNKPDGMVREERGPYGDPQHPYLYEEEDVWMAPGFINQFYEVPEYWKRYVQEVDTEREMWLNSFYKAPLRLPMPAELEHWWSKDHSPEFVLINKGDEPGVDDPSNREDPLILHTPTGRVINYVDDDEHGIRLFWQPHLKDGEDVDPKRVEFLPLGFDEFYGREVKEETPREIFPELGKLVESFFDKMEKWAKKIKVKSEMKMKLMEKELDLIEAELCLKEAIEDMDEELKEREKEELKRAKMGLQEEEKTPKLTKDEKKVSAEEKVGKAEEDEEEEEEEEEDEEEGAPSSFGTVTNGTNFSKTDSKQRRPGEPPFSTSSLGFVSCSVLSAVSSRLQLSFMSLKQSKLKPASPLSPEGSKVLPQTVEFVSYPQLLCRGGILRAARQEFQQFRVRKTSKIGTSQLQALSRVLSSSHSPPTNAKRSQKELRMQSHGWLHGAPEGKLSSILSLHNQVNFLEPYLDNSM